MKVNDFFSDYPDVLTPEEVQKILHTGRNTTYAMLMNGEIRSIKVGGKYRIPKLFLIDFLYPEHHFFESETEGRDTDEAGQME